MVDPIKGPASSARQVRSSPHVSRPRGQHSYQEMAHAFHHAHGFSSKMTISLALGVVRLQLSVPSQLRLLRFRCKQGLAHLSRELKAVLVNPRTRRSIEQALPLFLLTVLTAACSLVGGDGSSSYGFSLGPAPELSKKKLAPEFGVRRSDAPWTYVLPVDHGVRIDESGQGYFRAPRFHGEHNGLDLLAPIKTPVYVPCTGRVRAGVSQSFGNWVHVICPVPDQFAASGEPHPWASFFFAHLNQSTIEPDQWFDVSAGDQIGEVGKTGNAQGANIQPHLHMELIVQRNRRSAMDERHLGSDQSNVGAAQHFASVLNRECLTRYGFAPKVGQVQRARRIDPFIALTCLSDFKPNFKRAPSPLSGASREWTQFYVAKDFNVNLGVEDSLLVRR